MLQRARGNMEPSWESFTGSLALGALPAPSKSQRTLWVKASETATLRIGNSETCLDIHTGPTCVVSVSSCDEPSHWPLLYTLPSGGGTHPMGSGPGEQVHVLAAQSPRLKV